ncbi:toprim domain-containing protein [Patescibacteria group bacterium]|nr:toprim domain-containing protein [Patescibacteria group bacterium]MDE1946780.1 toprim domain-containing protein [Patescibacteria group bacterium]MDE2011088.1 toprim domain-containing protein [Patescibacteria group bacterium]MDE2233145.1 toprim domain-containing protein [Patescibacteria group bacterium]
MNHTTVEEIKAKLTIEDVIGSYVKLEKAGKSFKARCPFHNEKTASFFVSPERGGYYCFGCGAKGDIFSFVEQFEGLDFRGALKLLAEKAGVTLSFDRKADSERDMFLQATEEAAKYFETQFDKSKAPQAYVKSRGISDATRKSFRIGWAPDGWRNLSVYLKGRGYSDAILEKVGLIKRKDSSSIIVDKSAALEAGTPSASLTGGMRRGSTGGAVGKESGGLGTSNALSNNYDRFRGRIMFPISDSSGRVIAFSGRILHDDGKSAKYLNSPDTPLYDKSTVLYGLDKAKSEIRRLNYSILVEGQMDLVMSHQSGIKNTVAASGTALSDETFNENGIISNLGLVRRLSPNIIIAFDSDAAGRKAALRASGIALSLGMDVKIADIVGGKDPADLIKENADNWKAVLRAAKPIIEFELNNVMREVADARKLPKALEERVLPLLAKIESGGDRSYFVQMIAVKAKIPIDIVWQDLRIVEGRTKAADRSGHANLAAAVHTSGEQNKRIDLIERRLFGLLNLMEKDGMSQAEDIRKEMEKLAGNSFEARKERAKKIMDDLAFEAEAFFGGDKTGWQKNARELLFNFEEDIINEELIQAMQELRAVEIAGNRELLAELAKKCQALSVRKAEIGRRRTKISN